MYRDDYYEMLQVSRTAEQEAIEAAYRKLAKKYHPDVSEEPDAGERMKQINEAYEVLRDPLKRAEYDIWLMQHESEGESQGDSETDEGHTPSIPTIACQSCGRVDSTLRATVFQYVISIVVMSFKRGAGGIFCRRCRSWRAIGYSLLSLLFGIWGLPWGVFWTLEALFYNAGGGRQDREANALLLVLVARNLLARGDRREAIAALEASLRLHKIAGAEAWLATLKEEQSREEVGQPGESRRRVVPSFAWLLVVLFAMVSTGIWLWSQPQAPSMVVTPTQVRATRAPYATRTPTPLPTATMYEVLDSLLTPGASHGRTLIEMNFREGPGDQYKVLQRLQANTTFKVLGRDENCDWLMVRLPSGAVGWVWARNNFVQIVGPCSLVPLVSSRLGTLPWASIELRLYSDCDPSRLGEDCAFFLETEVMPSEGDQTAAHQALAVAIPYIMYELLASQSEAARGVVLGFVEESVGLARAHLNGEINLVAMDLAGRRPGKVRVELCSSVGSLYFSDPIRSKSEIGITVLSTTSPGIDNSLSTVLTAIEAGYLPFTAITLPRAEAEIVVSTLEAAVARWKGLTATDGLTWRYPTATAGLRRMEDLYWLWTTELRYSRTP